MIPVYIRSKQNSAKQFSRYTGLKLYEYQWDDEKNEPKLKNNFLLKLEGELTQSYQVLCSQGLRPTLADIWRYIYNPKSCT